MIKIAPEDQDEFDRLYEERFSKSIRQLRIAHTLAWVSAHAHAITADNLPRRLADMPAQLRRGQKLPGNVAEREEDLENLLHAVNFRRDFGGSHVHYQAHINSLVKNWSSDQEEKLQEHILETYNLLESVDAEPLQRQADKLFRSELSETVAWQLKAVRENEARRRQKLEEAVEHEVLTAMNPTAGAW